MAFAALAVRFGLKRDDHAGEGIADDEGQELGIVQAAMKASAASDVPNSEARTTSRSMPAILTPTEQRRRRQY